MPPSEAAAHDSSGGVWGGGGSGTLAPQCTKYPPKTRYAGSTREGRGGCPTPPDEVRRGCGSTPDRPALHPAGSCSNAQREAPASAKAAPRCAQCGQAAVLYQPWRTSHAWSAPGWQVHRHAKPAYIREKQMVRKSRGRGRDPHQAADAGHDENCSPPAKVLLGAETRKLCGHLDSTHVFCQAHWDGRGFALDL